MATVEEKSVLVLVQSYKAGGDCEQDLWRYRLSEGCIKQWYDKPSGYGCLSRKCEQGEHEAVSLLYHVSSPSSLTYGVKTQDFKHYISHHWPESPVTQQLGLWFLYCFSGLLALLLLTFGFASRIWSCHELYCTHYLPHTGFYYSKLLTYLCHDYSRFINISVINFNGSE